MTENRPQEPTSPMANAPAEQPAVPENPEEGKPGKKYPLAGCIALAFAIVFFSGVLSTSKEWYSAFDYLVLNGNFGTMKNAPLPCMSSSIRSRSSELQATPPAISSVATPGLRSSARVILAHKVSTTARLNEAQ